MPGRDREAALLARERTLAELTTRLMAIAAELSDEELTRLVQTLLFARRTRQAGSCAARPH